MTVLIGRAPVSGMREYSRQVAAFTGGRGQVLCSPGGYAPCSQQEAIVNALGYDPESDTENPTGSVFCAHGAGFIVPWDQVEAYMHLEDDPRLLERALAAFSKEPEKKSGTGRRSRQVPVQKQAGSGTGIQEFSYAQAYAQEQELREIFERTYGPVKKRAGLSENGPRVIHASSAEKPIRPSVKKKKSSEAYLLVDGYNMIFAWEELKKLSEKDIHAAQGKLMDILSNYQGITGGSLILVFDAYRVAGHREEVLKYHNIYVVYTKEAETADMYIEKTVHRLAGTGQVTVATSDALEQMIILGSGAARLSAREFEALIMETQADITQTLAEQAAVRNTLIDAVDPETAAWIQEKRLQH